MHGVRIFALGLIHHLVFHSRVSAEDRILVGVLHTFVSLVKINVITIKHYVVDLRDNVILILFPLPPGVVVTVGCVLMLIYTTAADPPEPRS